ncbi:MAG TPA: glycosyltransferase, partial [Anaeromyxobacteraceae bacterium]|nr:glycosyltransferase [Anaeromyxobacteraceae bacterium]
RRADLVIASSERLLESKRRVNRSAVLVRHGVDLAHFSRALDPRVEVPADLARLPRPVIGFFGLVADWIDLELVRAVADRYRHASVVLLGKVTTSVAALEGAPNVHFLGRKPYAALPAYCKGFDVAITPFRLNELALAANPLKAREYVAAGLPNVCTDLPELRAIPGCTVAPGPEAFVEEVGRWLGRGGPDPARSALVQDEGWEAKVEEMSGHLEALERRPRVGAASAAAS